MKIVLAILIVSLLGSTNLLSENISLLKEKSSEMKFTVIPYLQLTLVMPGVGCSARMQRKYLGLQLDANASSMMGMAGVEKITISGIVFPWPKQANNPNYGGWNITFGIGAGHIYGDNDGRSSIAFPLALGYQGQDLFFSCESDPVFFWLPTLKYGWVF